MNTGRYFVYKIMEDSGGATCVERRLLTLSICKPSIRRSASKGDWIFAFGSNSEPPANRLVYVAQITEKLTEGEYYQRAEYTKRGDCIYRRLRDGRYILRTDARFHNESDLLDYDIGEAPHFRNAITIVSTDFRYFGRNSSNHWKHYAPALTETVEKMSQGHRVNHSLQVRDELRALQKRLWSQCSSRVMGLPIHTASSCRGMESEKSVSGRKPETC